MATEKEEFRFDHRQWKSKKVDIDKLDAVMDVVLDSGTSTWGSIVAGIKVLIFFAYLWARKRLIDEEFMIRKQQYEQGRVNDNRDDLSQDDLD